ncbi:MAG: LuxR C-terminal-related transcriptional regulator [Clostridiales bacterium]|nr:LuxR C-terminal-related transcriptional regulator [Clostridiales bacterium]
MGNPYSPAAADTDAKNTETEEPQDMEISNLMPLLNCAFQPGHCLETVRSIKDSRVREIAMGEYYYFRGLPEEAMKTVKPFLSNADPALRMTACFVYTFASLSVANTHHTRQILAGFEEFLVDLHTKNEASPRIQAVSAFGSCFYAVLFHFPLKEEFFLKPDNVLFFSPGLRSMICYLQAHAVFLQRDFSRSIGIAQTALAFQPEIYPIPTIYLHMIAAMDYMGLKDSENAKRQILLARELAGPDGLIEIFAEHHNLLGGTLEVALKKDWPEDLRRIINVACDFSRGWRKIHCSVTGEEIADNLTTTEFSIAVLAAGGWTNQEIGDHLGIRVSTVKWHISIIFNKLGIKKRSDLARYILH